MDDFHSDDAPKHKAEVCCSRSHEARSPVKRAFDRAARLGAQYRCCLHACFYLAACSSLVAPSGLTPFSAYSFRARNLTPLLNAPHSRFLEVSSFALAPRDCIPSQLRPELMAAPRGVSRRAMLGPKHAVIAAPWLWHVLGVFMWEEESSQGACPSSLLNGS